MLNSLLGQNCVRTTREAIFAVLPDFKSHLPRVFFDLDVCSDDESSSLEVESSAAANGKAPRPSTLRCFSTSWDRPSNSLKSLEQTALLFIFTGGVSVPIARFLSLVLIWLNL